MSGSRPEPAEGHLAEQHLGDRLAALVDGELGHDARERVLAHVATCPKCKAEVDEQRRLKNVFAEAAPPPPSESLLARLQGLPGGGPDGGPPRFGDGGFGGLPGRFGPSGPFGTRREDRFPFDYAPAPAGPHAPVLPPSSGRGFRLHEVGRQDSDRSASRGLRFAFVAAGAVSLAAVALGGVTTGTTPDTAETRAGSNATPLRTQGTAAPATSDAQRRRASGPVSVQGGQQALGDLPAASAVSAAPLLPGLPSPVTARQHLPPLTTPVQTGRAAVHPLIRPLSATPPGTLNSWSAPPGLLAAPAPEATTVPSAPPSPSLRYLP